jgi:hypothetical protein
VQKSSLMHREDSIFYKTVLKDENHITDLFCNILKYKYIRDSVLRFFTFEENYLPIDSIEYEHIDTQKRIDENNKQPDIEINNSKCRCFFEIKTDKNRKLEKSQTTDYFKELSKNKKEKQEVFMIYLVPQNYKFEEEIKVAIDQKEVYANLFYWEDLLKYIEDIELDKSDIFISEFKSFILNILGKNSANLILNLKEMTLFNHPYDLAVANSTLKKIKSIIIATTEAVCNNKNINYLLHDKDHEYIVYFKDENEKYILFFGLWFELILNDSSLNPDYIFCYGVGDETSDEPFYDKYVKNFMKLEGIITSKETKGWWFNKFDKYMFSEEDDNVLIEKLSKFIKSKIDEIMN